MAVFRVKVVECKQEVSSFNPAPSSYEDFRIVRNAELLSHHRRVREEVGGALSILDANPQIEVVPGFGASAITSGGLLDARSFRRLCDELIGSLTAAATDGSKSVDAVYFSLHGAMQAEGEDDPEGQILQEARKALGDQIPFVVSLDLHGILTDRMLRLSDAIVAYHTYPHVDFFETGVRAAQVLVRILAGSAKPVTARVKIPALVRGDELITETGAIGECIRLAKQIEQQKQGLSAAVMWGNPFTDVPELRTNSFVVMDNDEEMARANAIELANRFWQHHKRMQVPLTSLAESIRLAKEVRSGTVVLMDAADATSSGAAGDSNAILRELVRQEYRGRALVPIIDPGAVRQAFFGGIGARVRVALGGAFDRARFTPIELTATVRQLSDGKFRSESFGWPWDSGDTAVLQADNVTLVVGTRPVSLFDRSWFYAHGQDPKHFDLVVVKSPHCEDHMFRAWCTALINVDAPGSTSANLKSLGHTRCPRPIFPLDDDVAFVAEAEIFRRP